MAKGYNPDKGREKQQARANSVAESNFGENVLQNLTREFEMPKVETNQIVSIPINELYSAPNNKEWDGFDKLSLDQEVELDESIYEKGQLEPITVWEIDKTLESIQLLYVDDIPKYDFNGTTYMILAGHSRTNSHKRLYEHTKEERFSKIQAIVRKDISFDTAQYIIKATNLLNRKLSAKDRREGTEYLYRKLNMAKTKGMNIAKKIAEDTGQSLRTVQYQISINEKLIPEFISMYDDGKISQTNILKLTSVNQQLQEWMYSEYKDKITNEVMKNFQKYFDRKELIRTLFVEQDIVYTDITTKVPSHLEKKFRDMTKNWLKRNK